MRKQSTVLRADDWRWRWHVPRETHQTGSLNFFTLVRSFINHAEYRNIVFQVGIELRITVGSSQIMNAGFGNKGNKLSRYEIILNYRRFRRNRSGVFFTAGCCAKGKKQRPNVY